MQKVFLHENSLLLTPTGVYTVKELAGKKTSICTDAGTLNAIIKLKPTVENQALKILYGYPQFFLLNNKIAGKYTSSCLMQELVLYPPKSAVTKSNPFSHFLGVLYAGGFKVNSMSDSKMHLSLIDPFGKDWLAIQNSSPPEAKIARSFSYNAIFEIFDVDLKNPDIKLMYHQPDKFLLGMCMWDYQSQINFLMGILNAQGLLHKEICSLSIYVLPQHLQHWTCLLNIMKLKYKLSKVTPKKSVSFNPKFSIKTEWKINISLPFCQNDGKTKVKVLSEIVTGQNFQFYEVLIYDNVKNITQLTLANGVAVGLSN